MPTENDNKPKSLTVKQQKFARGISQGKTRSEAVVDAGYNVSSKHNARIMGYQMMQKPHITNAVQAYIETEMPNLPGTAAQVLYEILLSPDSRPSDRIKAIEMLAKICGWNAPSKSVNINTKVESDKWKLPE